MIYFSEQTTHQEILSHKRVVESISDKANILVQTSTAPADIKNKVATVCQRYEQLSEASSKALLNLEQMLDVYVQIFDLQEAFKEYQKQQWDELTSCSDFTGNKASLEDKLKKVLKIHDSLGEGEVKLNVLEEHISKSMQIVSPRSQESMARDLNNLR